MANPDGFEPGFPAFPLLPLSPFMGEEATFAPVLSEGFVVDGLEVEVLVGALDDFLPGSSLRGSTGGISGRGMLGRVIGGNFPEPVVQVGTRLAVREVLGVVAVVLVEEEEVEEEEEDAGFTDEPLRFLYSSKDTFEEKKKKNVPYEIVMLQEIG